MTKEKMMPLEQAINFYKLLQKHYLVSMDDVAEGMAFKAMIAPKQEDIVVTVKDCPTPILIKYDDTEPLGESSSVRQEKVKLLVGEFTGREGTIISRYEGRGRIIDILAQRMPMPRGTEVYSKIKDAGGRHAVQWEYFPVSSHLETLPKIGFVRLAPRRLINNLALLREHAKKAKELPYKPGHNVFSTGKLFSDLIKNNANSGLVEMLGSVEGCTLLCHLEFWHYNPEQEIFYISSQAVLAADALTTQQPIKSGELKDWEKGTQRFWIRKRTEEKINSIIHEKRMELLSDNPDARPEDPNYKPLSAADKFYLAADKYPIIRRP